MSRRVHLIGCVVVTLGSLACGSSKTPTGTSAGQGSTGSAGSGSSGGATTGSASTSTGGGDAGGVVVGQTCDSVAALDICAPAGLVCDSQSSTCQLPGELQECLSSPGCNEAALTCLDGFASSQNGSSTISLCVRPCSATGDCPQLFTNCLTDGPYQFCFYDHCGPDGGYFGPCASAASGDGTCLPYPSISTGFCFGGGAQPVGATCSETRTDAGTGVLCQTGLLCTDNSVGNGPAATACTAICDTSADPIGPVCGDGDICVPSPDTGFGTCLESCGADVTCPQGTTCKEIQDNGELVMVCLPGN